jgi:hypothetical protein
MISISTGVKNFIYRVKNSNVIVSISINPRTWTLLPLFIKIPSYADDWLYEPDLLKYKFSWLFIKIAFFIETSTYDKFNFDYDLLD